MLQRIKIAWINIKSFFEIEPSKEEVDFVQKEINKQEEPNNVLIFYNEEGKELRDRFPLLSKFDKFMDEHTSEEICEIISFADNLLEDRCEIIYVHSDYSEQLINKFKDLSYPNKPKILLNKVSQLPEECGFVIGYKNGIEVHVF